MWALILRSLRAAAAGTFLLLLWQPGAASAFNSNNVMDESVFDNVTSMNASQIDSWLNNNFPNSCISTNHGFSAPNPTGYSPSGGFTYGGNVSAGQVIATSAQVYGLNPQVLLATLQKEQSLVSGDAGCSTLRYAAAVGYGCPDGGTTYSYSGLNLYTLNGTTVTSVSGTCVNSAAKTGFSQQVIRAAWLLKFGEQRSNGNTGWAVITGSWDNSDDPATCYAGPMTQGNRKRCSSDSSTTYYDGYTVIDGSSTHMDNGSTAALYWYTPHFSGNQNFDNIFTAWFGTIYGDVIGPSVYRLYSSSAHRHFFTAKENDRAGMKGFGYVDDSIGVFKVGTTQQAGMVPIYKLYNGRLHDEWLVPDGPALYWGAIYGGYAVQGVAFYAYPANPSPTMQNPLCQSGTLPVVQMWQGGLTEHFYTINGGDHYWGLVYGGYVDDASSVYKDANGGVSYCVPQ
ncbi:MAG TPA: hypothetical protein VJP80_07470 [Candidatus Saccharimonadales bacterium]|nr:hypothetical protein [Candidatus Saccharimonadales bacterium]